MQLAKTSKERDLLKELVSKETPQYRQAYSDRTAFIMACLSELVYYRFEEPFFSKNDSKLIDRLNSLINEEKLSAFRKLYDIFAYDSEEEFKKLKEELELLNINFVTSFDSNGTQAMIVSTDEFYVLVFRGTEPTSMKDIKTDLDAKIIECETGGKIHRGFNNAFNEVFNLIQDYLDNNLSVKKPLFITGHSLGGALATVATKKLVYKNGISACYTFGSPRVGNEDWMETIKTPIYRIVNSADPVTMVPPSGGFIRSVSWAMKFIPFIGETFQKKLISNYAGYYHAGDMRFLTNVNNSNYSQSKLLFNVTFFRRLYGYTFTLSSAKKIPSDHKMEVYRKKLKYIAMDRNKKD